MHHVFAGRGEPFDLLMCEERCARRAPLVVTPFFDDEQFVAARAAEADFEATLEKAVYEVVASFVFQAGDETGAGGCS
jgi:hypothetical protein